jgi:hypothetical protein
MRTFSIGRTARPSLRSRSRLLPGLITIMLLALAVSSCGVKNDLIKPNGQTTPKDTPDPSKPPYPIGR